MIPRALKKVTGGLPALNPNEARGDLLVPVISALYLYIVFAVCILLDLAMWMGAWCPEGGGRGLLASGDTFVDDD